MAIVRHRKSAVPGKIPSASGMTFGEIWVNYASGTGKSFLATLKKNCYYSLDEIYKIEEEIKNNA